MSTQYSISNSSSRKIWFPSNICSLKHKRFVFRLSNVDGRIVEKMPTRDEI